MGVYGTDAAGTVIIPTIMAEGPLIRYGADPTEDSTPEALPAWKNLQEQIGDLSLLETDARENLVSAINEVHSLLDADADAGMPAGAGLSETAAALLIRILRHAIYETNQTENINTLEAELGLSGEDPGGSDVTPEEPEQPEEPAVTLSYISVTYSGGDVPVDTAVTDLTGITVTAHYSDGSTANVTDYTIGGSIAVAGSNTLSVAYGGKTATFTVTGVVVEKTLTGITATYTGGSVPVGTSANALVADLAVMAQYSDGSTEQVVGYGLSGTISNAGENVVTVIYGGMNTTFTVTGIAEEPEKVVDQTETLELVYASGYPNTTTFAYTQAAAPNTYVVAKQGTLAGGELSVSFDSSFAKNWNLNLYAFDSDGNPYQATAKWSADPATAAGVWGVNTVKWHNIGDVLMTGFANAAAPFTVQIPEGCTFIACMRRGSAFEGDESLSTNAAFAQWAKEGGVTFTVTTYK